MNSIWSGIISNREQVLKKWPEAILFYIPTLEVPRSFADGSIHRADIHIQLHQSECNLTEVFVRPAESNLPSSPRNRSFGAVVFGDLVEQDLWSFVCIVHKIHDETVIESTEIKRFWDIKRRLGK